MLAIRTASDEVNKAQLRSIALESAKINDLPVDPTLLLLTAKNVSLEAGALICTIPCAFGTDEGKVSFTATSTGYRAKTVTVEASYSTKEGSCPKVMSNGTKIDILMAPV